jgi:hypothetical protein
MSSGSLLDRVAPPDMLSSLFLVLPDRRPAMKVALLITGSGLLVIVTSHASFTDPALIGKLQAKGIEKFIAYEVPFAMAKDRYGGHFQVAMQDLHETDDLRVLDFNGERAFRLFRLKELAAPVMFERDEAARGLRTLAPPTGCDRSGPP